MRFRLGKGGGRSSGRGGAGKGGRRHAFMNSESGNCICPACGVTVVHQRGVPCFQTKCPSCRSAMTRQLVNSGTITEKTPAFQGKIAPVIKADLCTGCGQCVDICPVNVISIINEKAVIDELNCNGCKVCISVCPESAIQ